MVCAVIGTGLAVLGFVGLNIVGWNGPAADLAKILCFPFLTLAAVLLIAGLNTSGRRRR